MYFFPDSIRIVKTGKNGGAEMPLDFA